MPGAAADAASDNEDGAVVELPHQVVYQMLELASLLGSVRQYICLGSELLNLYWTDEQGADDDEMSKELQASHRIKLSTR